jgi:hypothetical protein
LFTAGTLQSYIIYIKKIQYDQLSIAIATDTFLKKYKLKRHIWIVENWSYWHESGLMNAIKFPERANSHYKYYCGLLKLLYGSGHGNYSVT